MTFSRAVATCLRKYVVFSGRASRPEYWYFVLFLFAGSIAAGFLDTLIFGTTLVETEAGEIVEQADGPVASFFAIAMLLPSITAGWRRMHDIGRSGVFLLYPAIVMIGIMTYMGLVAGFETLFMGDFGALLAGGSMILLGIALVVFFLSPLIVLWWLTRPSEPGANDYGPNPQEQTSS